VGWHNIEKHKALQYMDRFYKSAGACTECDRFYLQIYTQVIFTVAVILEHERIYIVGAFHDITGDIISFSFTLKRHDVSLQRNLFNDCNSNEKIVKI
jgi:hypothetical protein